MNCWQFMQCGREEGGVNVQELGTCPAFPDHGQNCASVAGTICLERVFVRSEQKYTDCLSCRFYNSEQYDRCNPAEA